jgi:hypothetical protein
MTRQIFLMSPKYDQCEAVGLNNSLAHTVDPIIFARLKFLNFSDQQAIQES